MLEACRDLPQTPGASLARPKSLAVDIGGRRIAFTCSGQGAPTVVFETGLGAESQEWAEIYQGMESETRVLRYDRAGRGASDPAPTGRDALALVSELRGLLEALRLSGPYILVGHSFGGLLMRLFAHRYSECVAGLVLVDAMHEDQFDIFGPLFPPSKPSEAFGAQDVRAFWTGGWRHPRATVEHIDLIASCDQAREIRSLTDIPVHVIVAGTFLNLPGVPLECRAALQERWEHLQRRFIKLSSVTTYAVVRSSGHFMQRDAPHVVLDVLRAVVATSRSAAASRTQD